MGSMENNAIIKIWAFFVNVIIIICFFLSFIMDHVTYICRLIRY